MKSSVVNCGSEVGVAHATFNIQALWHHSWHDSGRRFRACYEGGVRLDSCLVQVVMAHSVLITQAEDHLSWNVARLWSSDEAQVNWYKVSEDKSVVIGREPTKCTVEMGDVKNKWGRLSTCRSLSEVELMERQKQSFNDNGWCSEELLGDKECPYKRDDGNNAMVVSPYKIWLWELGICRTSYGEIVRGSKRAVHRWAVM